MDTLFLVVTSGLVVSLTAALWALWSTRQKFDRWKALHKKVETADGLAADEWEELEKLSNG